MEPRLTTNPPRLAVLLCTHDGTEFLGPQLLSLKAQTLPPCAVFIHDWGSQDSTREMALQACRDAQAGTRWSLTCHDHAPGPARSFLAATLACLDAVEAFDYLLLCDQDDIWHASKLEVFARRIAEDPGLDLLYCDVELVDAAGRRLAERYLGRGGHFGRPMDIAHGSTLFVSTVSGMSLCVSRRFLEAARPAWKDPAWVMHDWSMTIVAHLRAVPTAFIDQSLVSYRQHGGNLVGGASSPRRDWRARRAYVAAVERQYQACVALSRRLGWRSLPARPGRWGVAFTVWRGRSFRPLQALKVALGYLVLWP